MTCRDCVNGIPGADICPKYNYCPSLDHPACEMISRLRTSVRYIEKDSGQLAEIHLATHKLEEIVSRIDALIKREEEGR